MFWCRLKGEFLLLFVHLDTHFARKTSQGDCTSTWSKLNISKKARSCLWRDSKERSHERYMFFLFIYLSACMHVYISWRKTTKIHQSISQTCIILECIYQCEKLFTLGRMSLCYCVMQARHLHRAPVTTYASHLMWDPEKMLVCCSWMRYFDQSALNGSACACAFALVPQSSFIKKKRRRRNYRKIAGQPLRI